MAVHRTGLIFPLAVYDGHEPIEGRAPLHTVSWHRFAIDNADAFGDEIHSIGVRLVSGEIVRTGGGAVAARTLCAIIPGTPAARYLVERVNRARGAA